MMLLVDIGNTRVKWAMLDGAELRAQSAAAHAGWDREQLVAAMLDRCPEPDRVIVGNVGGARIGELLREAVHGVWNIGAQFIHSTSQFGEVRNAYPEPANLGVDRWLAMLAVHAMERAPACIVSVGTAMTVDALDSSGQHLGGVIVPGPDLMVSSLLRNTSEIASRAMQGNIGADVFANNTLGGIRQGSVHALAALVERAMQAMQARIATTPVLYLTGGASASLEGVLRMPYRHVADLVLRGLAVVANSK